MSKEGHKCRRSISRNGSNRRVVIGTDAFRWSHPIEVDVSGNTRKFLAIPVKKAQESKQEALSHLRSVTTLLNPSGSAWELSSGNAAQDPATTSRQATAQHNCAWLSCAYQKAQAKLVITPHAIAVS